MLTQEENELLCRVGPGTPMGELLRRYWIPALCSSELAEPDGPPIQVKLLAERLVAFRDTNGRVGVLDEFCPHRGTSLWLGRNEDLGLRCVFHGWKFDVDGNCVEQMNEAESFAGKIRATAYPTAELGGMVWAYMGPPEKLPPLPKFEWTQAPETHRSVSRTWEECSWLQALEGGVDTSHVPILHRLLSEGVKGAGYRPSSEFVRSRSLELEVEPTDYGYRYASVRTLGDEGQYVRSYHFVMPFTQIRPQQIGNRQTYKPLIAGHYWVPMDDENCMVWNWAYSFGDEPLSGPDRSFSGSGNSPEDVDPANDFRKLRNKDNRWMIDRGAQKVASFSGIQGLNTQDHAVHESMGAIANRTKEHLGPADRAIIATRQLLLKAARTVEDGGDPPGLSPSYYRLRAIERVLPHTIHWWDALRDECDPEPAGAR